MKSLTITAVEFDSQPEAYLDAALEGNFVYIEMNGRHVCLLSDDNWRLMVETMDRLLEKTTR